MTNPAPPIITQARDLLANYDVLFCDVWGVIHERLSGLPWCGARSDGVPPQRWDRGAGVECPYRRIASARCCSTKKFIRKAGMRSSPPAPSRYEHVARKKYEAVYAIGRATGMRRSWRS